MYNIVGGVIVNCVMQIEEGGEAQITAAVLSVMDVDTPLTDLFIVVGTMPNFGSLHNRKPGKKYNEIHSSIYQKCKKIIPWR